MLPIRNSISNSFKLFQKSLQTLTALFSCSETETAQYYHRIPKPDPKAQISCHPETEMSAQTSSCSYIELEKPRRIKNRIETPQIQRNIARGQETGERLVVAAKLKQLVMMDRSNVDHVLDIEEVLHYYSRLRSPVYLDLFHKFFMEMCSEFARPPPRSGPNRAARSRRKFPTMRLVK